MLKMDLNSDLGESFGQWKMGDDDAMLDIVSSANIACGFHAGDPLGIYKTVRSAAKKGIAIGAHVAYPDLVGFGRRKMDIDSDELTAGVIYQIGALQGIAAAAGTKVQYVKPHGALYNTIANDEKQGMAVIKALQAIDPSLKLVCLAGSPLLSLAKANGLSVIAEAFADRAYTAQGTLVSRRENGAVIHDTAQIAARMLQLVTTGKIVAVDGTQVQLQADSICVHGDSPGAVAIARTVKATLEKAGIHVTTFTA